VISPGPKVGRGGRVSRDPHKPLTRVCRVQARRLLILRQSARLQGNDETEVASARRGELTSTTLLIVDTSAPMRRRDDPKYSKKHQVMGNHQIRLIGGNGVRNEQLFYCAAYNVFVFGRKLAAQLMLFSCRTAHTKHRTRIVS
jgi:hypothetical protein